jgi:predicted ATPase/tetratricopeptide (TPR) repeat protein
MARRGPPLTNLPVERGAFVGRERGLAAIARVLADDDAAAPRVLALTGPPGVGKTRLALRAAARELPRFGHEGGVWLMECLDAVDAAGLVRLLGLMLGLLPDASAPAAVERVRITGALRERGPALIVVDAADMIGASGPSAGDGEAGGRADVVDDGVAVLQAIAAAVPSVRFMVTRRKTVVPEPGAGGVAAFTVGPLSASKRAGADDSEAAQLFIERVAEARATHTRSLSPQDVVAIGHVVRQLEGLPQAIELAAARCRVLSPGELLERLPRNLGVLSGPARSQLSALAGVVAWSLDLLQPWERATLAQCVIFHGGFTLAAARDVVDLSEVPNAPAIDAVLESLVEKALLKVMARDDDEEVRFTHPPAVRELIVQVRPGQQTTGSGSRQRPSTLELLPAAWKGSTEDLEAPRLELATTRAELNKRHATWTLSRCGALKENVDGHGGLLARRALEREQDNLLAVVRRSLGEDTATLTSLTHALLALAALEPVMTTRGPHELFARLLDRALEPAEAAGVRPALVARSREMRARLRRTRGQLSSSKEDLDAGLLLARKARDRLLESRALANLGTHALFVGDLTAARAAYDAAIARIRAEGDVRLEARCVGFYGLLEEEADNLPAAVQHYKSAIEMHVQTGDRRWEAIHGTQLARVKLRQGDVDGARELLRRSLVQHRELRNRRMEGLALILLGDIAAFSMFFPDADAAWQRAVLIARDIGDPTLQALVHARLALSAERRGEDAREHHAVVDAAVGRTDDPQIMAAVGTLRGAPLGPGLEARGVQVRAAELVVKAMGAPRSW